MSGEIPQSKTDEAWWAAHEANRLFDRIDELTTMLTSPQTAGAARVNTPPQHELVQQKLQAEAAFTRCCTMAGHTMLRPDTPFILRPPLPTEEPRYESPSPIATLRLAHPIEAYRQGALDLAQQACQEPLEAYGQLSLKDMSPAKRLAVLLDNIEIAGSSNLLITHRSLQHFAYFASKGRLNVPSFLVALTAELLEARPEVSRDSTLLQSVPRWVNSGVAVTTKRKRGEYYMSGGWAIRPQALIQLLEDKTIKRYGDMEGTAAQILLGGAGARGRPLVLGYVHLVGQALKQV